MHLDPNKCRVSMDGMRRELMLHKGQPRYRCAEMSALSGVPVLAVVLYAMRPDMMGPLPELAEAARDLTIEGKYTTVEGWHV